MIPKNPPLRDKDWRATIREMPCMICMVPSCDPAHIRWHFFCAGDKPPDNRILPLCRGHHTEQGNTGEVRFWRQYMLKFPRISIKIFGEFRPPETEDEIMMGLLSYANNLYINRI